MTTTAASAVVTKASKSPCQTQKSRKTSLHHAMNNFFDRDDAELQLGSRTDYEHTLLILEEYINTFGSAMLRAEQREPTFTNPKEGLASECYDSASLLKFFRGFVLFFLQYKVNAPKDFKETIIKIVGEFVEWLSENGHLPNNFEINLERLDAQSVFAAAKAGDILAKAVAHSERARKRIEDIRDAEPLYIVSRVKSKRLWFIYWAENQYDEFGPVSVPLGASEVIKPGWLVECTFGKYDGRWQIRSVGNVLSI